MDRLGSFFGIPPQDFGSETDKTLLSLNVQAEMVTVLWENEIWLEKLVYDRRLDEAQ